LHDGHDVNGLLSCLSLFGFLDHLHFEGALGSWVDHGNSLLVLLLLSHVRLHHFLFALRRLLLHVKVLRLHLLGELHELLLLRRQLLLHHLRLELHLGMLLGHLLHLLQLLLVHLSHNVVGSWVSFCAYWWFILENLVEATYWLCHLFVASIDDQAVMDSKFREFHLRALFVKYIGWLFNSI